MPQAPTPNMQIIWPSDLSDANAWAAIMDTAVRVVIDGHNHAPGAGAQIHWSSIGIDADKSMIDGSGNKYALYNLKAAAFAPQPPSAIAGFPGAFFIGDGTGGTVVNELYYRTVGGALVQFTNGATMNSAFFVGGIGGDYSAVGALEIYDDASTAFVFQQETGAGFRQYAKLRGSDLLLYPYQVHGTASPPSLFSVALKAPAGLAGNIPLTFPGALPAATSHLTLDASGNISVETPTVDIYEAASVLPITGGIAATLSNHAMEAWALPAGSTTSIGRVRVPVGHKITAWSVQFRKTSAATGTLTAYLFDIGPAVNANPPTQIGATQSTSANAPGAVSLGQAGLTAVVSTATFYQIVIESTAASGDWIIGYSVTHAPA